MAIALASVFVCISLFAFFLFIALPGPDRRVKAFLATELRQSAYSLFMVVFMMVTLFFVLDALRMVL